MSEVDTSADDDIPADARAVRHFAEVLREKGYGISANIMEALLSRAERAEQERDAANITCDTAIKAVTRANEQRDAAQAKAERLRRGWLTTIQQENSCPATGGGCLANWCGCIEEMKMLMREADEMDTKEPGHE